MGRPTEYSEELIDRICKEISTSSKGLVKICENTDYPCVRTLYNWLADKDKTSFLHKYTRAREEQADFLADEIIEIADDSTLDHIKVDSDSGSYTIENKEWVNRSKLRVDARKWKASKLAPKKYGDKLDVTTDNKPINSLDLSHLTFDQLKELANDKGPNTEVS